MIERKLFYASLIAFFISLLFLVIFSLALNNLNTSKYSSNCTNTDTTNSLGKLSSTLWNALMFMAVPIVALSLGYMIYYMVKGRKDVAQESAEEQKEERSWKKIFLYIFIITFIISLIATIIFSMALSELDSSQYSSQCNSTAVPYLDTLHSILLYTLIPLVILMFISLVYMIYYLYSSYKAKKAGSEGSTDEKKITTDEKQEEGLA